MSEEKIRITSEDVANVKPQESVFGTTSTREQSVPPIMDIPKQTMHLRFLIGVGIAVIIVFFGIFFLFQSYKSNQEAQHIKQVLSRVKGSNAKSASEEVAYLQAVNLSGCPNDFKVAYLAYVEAWGQMEQYEQDAAELKDENSGWRPFITGFIHGMVGDISGPLRKDEAERGQLKQEFVKARDQIGTTGNRLLEIAVAHGVN